MKMKNIILITFLLLAVLTIGAASATDDVASDNMTVNDDSDALSIEEEDPYEEYELSVEDDDSICIDPNEHDYDENASIAYLDMPLDGKGSFQIWNDEEVIVRCDFDADDEEHWEIDDDTEIIYGYILLKDLDLKKIKNNDTLYLKYFDDGQSVPVDSLTVVFKVTLNESYMTLTEIDNVYEFEDVEVNYPIDFAEGVTIEEGWDETELIAITVNNDDLNGRVEVWINKTLTFNKALNELDVNSEEDYIISIKDLNINKEGTYEINCYIYDNNGAVKYNSTEEEDEQPILSVYESQTVLVDGVRITVIPTPIPITGNESFIIVDSSASEEDNITVYIDNEKPITIKLNNTRTDEETGDYLIGSKELKLKLKVGEHNVNITYKGKNIPTQKINLVSNIEIHLGEGTVYTGFDDEGFVLINLREGEIKETQIEGKINVTIIDYGNPIATFEEYIDNLYDYPDEDVDARIVTTDNMNPSTLNGTYSVIVRYFDGNDAETQVEGNVTFKTLTAKDYGTSINPVIKDENDSVITFKNLPLIDNIRVEIDGTEVDYDAYIEELYEQEGNYSIKFDKLEGLADGPHKISVYLEKNIIERIELASENVIVDLEENIDPALTISVTNIEEGNAATVVITTNNTFTGNITVQIANTNYQVNVVKGQGSTQISGLKANTYTATALFKSDGIFTDATKTATFKVTAKPASPSTPAAPAKKVIKLTLKKVKVKKSAKKLVLKATLKINGKAPKKGTKIKFTFKGKKYIGKTNKKGVAKVIIKKKVLKKLKVGKKVKYTAKYSTKTVKRTAKVKR